MNDDDDNDLPTANQSSEPTGAEEVKTGGIKKHQEPSLKIKAMLEGLEMFSATGGSRPPFSLGDLSDSQRDKALDIVAKNEDNAYKYHTKKLDVIERINIRQIEASTVGRRTFRYTVIGCLCAVFILTVLILFYAPTFFMSWLTFLTGLAGGFGISKATQGSTKQHKISDPTAKEEIEED